MRWLLAGSVAQRVISLGALALIARLISEDYYGIHREMLSIHAILFVLLPLGFDQLLAREQASSATYTRALRGALMVSSLVIILLALVGHTFIRDRLGIPPEFGWLLFLLPFVVLVQAAKLRYKTPLTARLKYRPVSVGEVINTLVSMATSLVLLYFWRSPGALYVGFTLGEIAEFIYLRNISARHTESPVSDLRQFTELGRKHGKFSALYCTDQVLNTVGANAPVLVLGAALGHAAAGGYAMASSLIMLPLSLLVAALAKVALPALAGRSEPEMHARALQLVSGGAAFIAPALIGIATVSTPLVHVVLGASWVDSTAPLLRWLAIYCVLVGVFSPISAVDILRDRMDIGFAWNAATLALRLLALWWGQQHSIVHAVAAFSLVSAGMWLVNAVILAWLLRAGQWRFHRTWLRFVPGWLAVGLAGVGCAWLARYSPWLALAATALPALLYVALLRWLMPDAWRMLLQLARLRRAHVGSTPLGENTGPTPDHGVPVP